jgi:hypothetical protein
MIADYDGLSRIANTEKPERQADIVFVHGLGGGSHSTWRHGQPDQDTYFFWPEALGKERPHWGIWSFGYPAGFTYFGKPGMIIGKRAGNLALTLANANLGDRPLLFITHSMGGLIVKTFVVDSQLQPDANWKRQVSWVRGIVFCATPHRGSDFATAAKRLGKFFGGIQSHVSEMRSKDENLDRLHDHFLEWHRRNPVPVETYAENIGLMRTRWWRRPLPLGLVVERSSANTGIAGSNVWDVDDDHLTLVKPPSSTHLVFAGVLRFFDTALRDASTIVPGPPTGTDGDPQPSVAVIEQNRKEPEPVIEQIRKDPDSSPDPLQTRAWPVGELPMCIEMELPDAVRTNPKYWPRNVPPADSSRYMYDRVWPRGVWLRVRFMDGTPEIQEAVSSITEEWGIASARFIHFAFGDFPEAEIRISFSTKYLWSYVGTDALFVPPDKPTLCLGAIATVPEYTTIRAAVLHEFGHALGLIHTPRYLTSHAQTGEHERLGKGFNDYFAAALTGHFRNGIHANNVRDLVMKQSFRSTRVDLTQGGNSIMRHDVPSGYTFDRIGDDTSVYGGVSRISEKDAELLLEQYKWDLHKNNPFNLRTSKPEMPVGPNGEIRSS